MQASGKVKHMQNPLTWRALLGMIIRDPQEEQRLANELGIKQITLTRWVTNDSKPRLHNLHKLVKALPEHRASLLALLADEFEEFSSAAETNGETGKEIPSTFYARVFQANAELTPSLRSWLIRDIILQQALEQLDPERQGMAVIVVQCMPPTKEHFVRSLREVMGRGISPWSRDLEQQAILLGAESMAGYVVTTGHSITIQNLNEDQGLFPAHRAQWEESSTAHPILRGNLVAGCLLVSSAQPNYFTQERLTLIQNYADLLVLGFAPEEFYELERIKLGVMPQYDIQRVYLATFQERVYHVMLEAARKNKPINSVQAEQMAWQQLEGELIQLSSQTNHEQG
jgi:hypothetical protein